MRKRVVRFFEIGVWIGIGLGLIVLLIALVVDL